MITAQNDRRAFRRMAIESPVRINKEGGSQATGVCKDLSATGMLIELAEESFDAGDSIMLSLGTGDNRVPPLNAEAKVLRISKLETAFEMAVEFIVVS